MNFSLLLSKVISELAFDGPDGTKVNQIWKIIESNLAKSKKSESSLTEWHDDVAFSLRESIRGDIPKVNGNQNSSASNCDIKKSKSQELALDFHVKEYLWKLILNEKEISVFARVQKNKKSTERVDFKKEDLCEKPFHALMEEYESNIYLRCSEDKHRRAVCEHHAGSADFSDQLYRVLACVARSRSEGITQAEIAKRLKIDPRSIFYFIKRLTDIELIKKSPVVKKGVYTNNLIHRHFWNDNATEAKTDDCSFFSDFHKSRKKISELLEGARNKTMAILDIKESLGFAGKMDRRRVQLVLAYLAKAGYVERVDVASDDKIVRCYRSLCPYSAESQEVSRKAVPSVKNSKETVSNPEFTELLLPSSTSNANQFFSNDIPLDQQVFEIVRDSKDEGVTLKEISFKLGGIYTKLLDKILTLLVNSPISNSNIVCESELVGKNRRHRYFYREKGPPLQKKKDKKRPITEDISMESVDNIDLFQAGRSEGSIEVIATPIPTVTLAEDVKKSKSNGVPARSSTTAAIRRENILKYLKIHKIIELNLNFITIFQEIYEKDFDGKMDKKTLVRSARILHDEKLAQLIEIEVPRFSGVTEKRLFLISNEIGLDSQIYVDYMNELRDKSFASVRDTSNTATTNIAVRSIDFDRLNPQNSNTAKNDSQNSTAIAQGYGWVSAKMIRAKLLHKFLWLCKDVKEQHTERTDGTLFTIADIYRNMTLQVYLQVIGHGQLSEQLTKYICSGESLNRPLLRLDNSLAAEIYSESHRFRRIFKQLLGILSLLKLISKETTGDKVLQFTYKLETNVDLCDYSLPDYPAIKSYILSSSNLEEYWCHLEEICRHRSGKAQSFIKEDSNNEQPLSNPLSFLSVDRNWTIAHIMTEATKSKLQSYIDEENGTTPLDKPSVLLKIATECGLPVQKIKKYYRNYLSSQYSNGLSPLDSKTEDDKTMMDLLQKAVDLSMSDNQISPFDAILQGIKHDLNVHDKRKASYEIPQSLASITLESSNDEPTGLRRWMPDEDNIILTAGIVMHHRSEKVKWSDVLPLFNDRKVEALRRRYSYLKQMETSKFEELSNAWPQIYRMAISEGKLTLKHTLIEEIALLLERQSQLSCPIVLPETFEDFHILYEIRPLSSQFIQDKAVKNRLDACNSRVSYLDVFYERDFYVYNESEQVNVSDKKQDILCSFIKSTLMIKDSEFDGELAARILKQFMKADIEASGEKLKTLGVYAENKQAGRRLPGRGIYLSKRFETLLNGVWGTEFFEEVRKFKDARLFGNADEFEYDPLSSGSASMSIMNMLADGDLEASPDLTDEFDPKAFHTKNPPELNCKVTFKKRAPTIPFSKHPGRIKRSFEGDMNLPSAVTLTPATSPSKDIGVSHKVLDILVERQQQGLSLAELIRECGSLPSTVINDVRELISEGKICRVGYNDHRLVAQQYAREWMISVEGGEGFVARIWNDMKGNIMVDVFKKLLHAVLSYIVANPSITETELQQRMILLNRCEVIESLEYLVMNGFVKFETTEEELSFSTEHNHYFPSETFYSELRVPVNHDTSKSKATLFRNIKLKN